MPISIALQSSTEGAAIFYTLDGSTPTSGARPYTEPIVVDRSTSVRAIAVRAGLADSPVAGGAYELVRRGVTSSGTVLFDRGSIRALTPTPAVFWVRDESTGQPVAGVLSYYDTGTGRFALTGLPASRVGIQTTVTIVGQAPTLAGNYYGWKVSDLTRADPARTEPVDARVSRVIHLLAPLDNSQPSVPGPQPLSSPVRLAWEAVPEARWYHASVRSWRDGAGPTGVDTNISLRDPEVTLSLAALPPDTHYEFALEALNDDGDEVGVLMITSTNGYGSYRFTVR